MTKNAKKDKDEDDQKMESEEVIKRAETPKMVRTVIQVSVPFSNSCGKLSIPKAIRLYQVKRPKNLHVMTSHPSVLFSITLTGERGCRSRFQVIQSVTKR